MNIAASAHARNPSTEEIFEGGWCHAPNGLFDHPYFTKEDRERPLSRREAVLWIAKHVRWTDNCTVRRGQGAWSLRYLAEAWRWTKDRVSRFLKQLEKLRIIRAETATVTATATATAQYVITYLFSTCYVAPKAETATGARQQRDGTATKTKEGNLDSEPKGSCGDGHEHPDGAEATATAEPSSSDPSGAAKDSAPPPGGPRPAARKSPAGYSEDFEAAWKAMPSMARKRGSKPLAAKLWAKLSQEQRIDAMAGIAVWEDNQYAMAAERWLRDERWIGLLEATREKEAKPKQRNYADEAAW